MGKPTADSQNSTPSQPERLSLKIEMQTTGLKEFFENVLPGTDVVATLDGVEISRYKMPENR